MQEIMKKLLDQEYYTYKDEEGELNYFIANKDKIVFLLPIHDLEEIKEIVLKISEIKREIIKNINLNQSKLLVDKEGELVNIKKNITIPAFLWDLYVVGIHDISIEPKFDLYEMEKVKRDNFIARKIIIEYKNLDELSNKLKEEIFPEISLKDRINNIKPPKIDINDLIKGIELNDNLNIYKDNMKDISIKNIVDYLDNIILEYIDKK